MLEEFRNKLVLILGFGREGQDSFLFLRKKFPVKMLGIADEKEFEEFSKETQKLLTTDKKIILYLGEDYLKALKQYDIIIKAPGIPLKTVKPFLSKSQVISSQTNIFFDQFPGTIIGVTGTKGKSTVSSLIYEVLKNGRLRAFLAGNIGKPVLQFLENTTKDDVFVYELSSFQLETITKSPHIAVLLNLYPEHLDHHETLKNYLDAKANITKFQSESDYLIFDKSNQNAAKIAAKSNAKKIPFTPMKRKNPTFLAPTEPAVLVGCLFNIPQEKIHEAIRNFKPLPHRLELVGKFQGVTFYNDSLATIPEAAIGAIDALGKDVSTIILGGFDRGIILRHLAEKILKSNIKTLILFPTTGETIWKDMEKLHSAGVSKKMPRHFFVNTMENAVQLCYQHTPKGKICLLSPASSSFNLFRDYQDRGEQFRKFVVFYGKKKHS